MDKTLPGRSGLFSQGPSVAASIPTGATRMTPPHPLLLFCARSPMRVMAFRADRQVFPGPRRSKRARCLISQPSTFSPFVQQRGLVALRQQPPQVRAAHRARHARDAVHRQTNVIPQHPLRGEERHLGVVRDGSEAPVGGGEVADAAVPEGPENLLGAHELDRRAERIADGAAEQAAPEAASLHGIARDTGEPLRDGRSPGRTLLHRCLLQRRTRRIALRRARPPGATCATSRRLSRLIRVLCESKWWRFIASASIRRPNSDASCSSLAQRSRIP